MYRLGHTGIALLVLAPLSYGLLEAHKPLLTLIISLGVLGIEPLPDFDFKVPFFSHRGVSHSLFAAVSVGGIIALCGWFVGGQVVTVLASLLGVTSEVVTVVVTSLESLAPLDTTGGIVAWVVGLLTEVVANLDWIVSQLQSLDRQTIAGVGFVIGAGGILVHLFGDVITVSGIRPFLPFSDWKVSVSPLHAKSTLANTGFFTVGVLAVAVVLATTVTGIGVAVAPADLSPIGIAAGQSQTASANQTQNQSRNANSTPAVVFANQTTTNGSTVTIKRVTLPKGGFVVLDSTGRDEEGPLEESAIAVSQRLSAGTHRNVTLHVTNSPPGGFVNRTTLNHTGTYEAILYRDSNNNSRFEFITSGRSKDRPFIVGSGSNARLASDSARVTVPGSRTPTPTASVRFQNQTTNGSTVTVQSVTLPRGGWVVVHNQSYLRGGDPLSSAIGISRYLPAGTHERVTVRLLNGSVQRDQTLVAIPSQDTNDNQRYDYVRSDGFRDVPYTGSSGVIIDRAQVSVSGGTTTATATSTTPPTETMTERSVETGEASGSGGGGSWLPDSPLIIVALALVIVALAAIRKLS